MKIIDLKDVFYENDFVEIKKVILDDGIIVFPTETVYGIGANIYSNDAINKIFKAKGRPSDNPLIVHISNLDMLNNIVTSIDSVSKKLMDNFWPGPLTIILPKKETVSDLITAGLNTVGVRMPSNEIALNIIEACNVPIAAPSANISGKPSGTNIKDIYDELSDKVDLIIDGGNTDIGLESTVVKVIDGIVHILRPVGVTKEDIESIGLSVFDKNINNKVDAKEIAIAPGMKYRHYSPDAETILVYSDNNDKIINKINEIIDQNNGKKIIVIASYENSNRYNSISLVMGSNKNLNEISKNIFSILREADRMKPDLIIVEGVISNSIGSAIMNRLIKACSNNYIKLN